MIITDNLKLKLLGRLENFDTETIMEDLQKIDTAYGSTLNNLTDAFDPTKQYQIREYCIKDNVLYKFISTKEAGDWDDSVVVSTTISNEMKEMNATLTQLNSKIKSYIIIRSVLSDKKDIQASLTANYNIVPPDIKGYIPILAIYDSNNASSNIIPYKVTSTISNDSFSIYVKNIASGEIKNVFVYAYVLYVKS